MAIFGELKRLSLRQKSVDSGVNALKLRKYQALLLTIHSHITLIKMAANGKPQRMIPWTGMSAVVLRIPIGQTRTRPLGRVLLAIISVIILILKADWLLRLTIPLLYTSLTTQVLKCYGTGYEY